METKFVSKLRFREDTAANWTIVNPVLDSSEPARETDTGAYKIGDGVTPWRELPYQATNTAVIPDVSADGKLYARTRTASGELGTWQAIINDTRHNFNDLLQIPYDAPLNMGYKLTLPDGTKKTVYGIKKFFGVNALPSTKVTEKVLDGVYSIVQVGGTFEVDEDETYLIPTNTDTFRSDVTLNASTHTVYVTTQSTQQRNNAKIDIWLMYTKVDDSNTDDDYHGTIGGGSTGGDSGSSPDTPSNPGLSFEQMLDERGLLQVVFKYPDKDVVKIVNKNSIIDPVPDSIPDNCIFLGWSVTDDLNTPILRFENHCTVYPIFREVTDEQASTMFRTHLVGGNGSTADLMKGRDYLDRHVGANGGTYGNIQVIILGYADTPGSLTPITNVPDLSKEYYAITTVQGLDRIEPSTRALTLPSELQFGDEYKDETYTVIDGMGVSKEYLWCELRWYSYKWDDNIHSGNITTPAGEFIPTKKLSKTTTIDPNNLIASNEEFMTQSNGTFYVVYELNGQYYTVEQINETYSRILTTVQGTRVLINDEQLADYKVNLSVFNSYLEYKGVTNDATSIEASDTLNENKEVYLIYTCVRTNVTFNTGSVLNVRLNYFNGTSLVSTNMPYQLIDNYKLNSFITNSIKYEFAGYTNSRNDTTIVYTNEKLPVANAYVYPVYKDTSTEQLIDPSTAQNLYRNREETTVTIRLQKPFSYAQISKTPGSFGVSLNTEIGYLPEEYEGIGWSLTNCDTAVDTCPELIENIQKYLTLLTVPENNLVIYYIYKVDNKYCSLYKDMGTVRYTLYSDTNTRTLSVNFKVYDVITTVGSAAAYSAYEQTISNCTFIGWTKNRIEDDFAELPNDIIDHIIDLIGTIVTKAETLYAIYRRADGTYTQNPTIYVNATFIYKNYYIYHSATTSTVKVTNELIPTSNSTYTSIVNNTNNMNITDAGSPPSCALVGWVHTTDGLVTSEQPTFADMSAKYTKDVTFIAIYKHPDNGYYYPATIDDFDSADTGVAEGYTIQRVTKLDGSVISATYRKLSGTHSSQSIYNGGVAKSHTFAGYKLVGNNNDELINTSTFDWKTAHELVEVYKSGSDFITNENVIKVSFVIKNYTSANTNYLAVADTCTIEQLDTILNRRLHQNMYYNETWYSDEALTQEVNLNTPLINSITLYGNATRGASKTVQVIVHSFTGTKTSNYNNRNLWSQLLSNSNSSAPYGYTTYGFVTEKMDAPSDICPALVNDDILITDTTLELYTVYKHIDGTYFTDTMPEYDATNFSSQILCYGLGNGAHRSNISECWLETSCTDIGDIQLELVGFTLDRNSKECVDFNTIFEINDSGEFNTEPYEDPETGAYDEIYLYGIFKDVTGKLYTDADIKNKGIYCIWSSSWNSSVARVSYLEGGITKEQLASKLESNVKSYCSSTSGPKLTYIGFAFESTSSEPIDINSVSLEAILDANLYAIYTYDEGTKVLYSGNSKSGSVRNGGITGTGVSYLYYFNYEHLRSYLKSYIGKQTSSGVVEAILDNNTVIDLETYEPKSNSYLTFKYVTA